MAWIRLNTGQELVLNLEHCLRIQICPGNKNAGWEVQALTLEDRSLAPTTLLRGTKPECEMLVDEIAKLVWAMDVER
jgi:hypothetical protein